MVVQLFTAYYDLARGGVSAKRENVEFVGRRTAASFDHVSDHGVSLPLSPPRADAPDDWDRAVDAAAGRVLDVRSIDGTDSTADGNE